MPEGLQTPEGKPVEVEKVEQEFARAMAAPPSDSAADLPKRAEPAKDAEKPRARRGRPPKAERARTADKVPAADQHSDKDYSEQLVGLTTNAWLAVASLPPTQPYAAVLKLNQPQLVAGLNAAAQNNAKIRAKIEKLSSGGGGLWGIQLAICGANMAMQSWQVMRDPELRAQMGESTRNDLKEFLTAQGLVLEAAKAEVSEETPDGTPAQ